MKLRIAGMLVASLLLSGCTDADWTGAMTSIGLDSKSDDAAAPVDIPTALPPVTDNSGDSFCTGVARSAAWDAAQINVGPEGQGRIAEARYRDCMAKSTHNSIGP
jgi:hypothetical protein